MKVGVVDYGVGNLGSVSRALETLDVIPVLVKEPRDLHPVDCVILPGVGNFTESKALLDAKGWPQALQDEVKGKQKPLLGICLGMQLLADRSMEGADNENGTAGLGFISGEVRSLSSLGCKQRVPHMGWNAIRYNKSDSILVDIPEHTDFYFVHSYGFLTKHQNDVIAVVDYDITVAAVVGKDNIWGTQFHPEKSSSAGFQILRNFIGILGC